MRRKRTDLIPVEESRKIIRLNRRGKRARTMEAAERATLSAGVILSGLLAVACLIYCLSIFFFMGYGSKFFLIWGVLAAVFGGMAALLAHRRRIGRIPVWIRITFGVVLLAGILCFVSVEGLIFSEFHCSARENADYMIVLGAQWKSTGPSYVLQRRLDKALEYLQVNPDTYVIVSGGQGANETISEAAGMKAYLMERGIAEERIYLEDRSTSTEENLRFSAKFMDNAQDRVVLVTNNFHMYRALRLAQKQGYQQIEGLAASSYPGMLPNNMLRESLAVVKEFLAGNI